MQKNFRKRYVLLGFSVLILFFSCWLAVLFQKKQHLIGAGINRTFLFLLINAHLILSIFLLFLIIRHSIKLYIERRKKTPGSEFKRNLLFSFIIFSLIPVIFVFFIAGKLITTSIDNWFEVRLGAGLEHSLLLHEEHTKKERLEIMHASDLYKKNISKPKNISLQDSLNYDVYVWGAQGQKNLDYHDSISDEVQVWRKFRKVNDRTTQTLRINFFKKYEDFLKNKNKNKKEKKVFDFYGSLYCVQKIGDAFLVLVHRYPEKVRNNLIQIQNAIDDYYQLKSVRNPIYWNYFFTFLLVTLLVLFLSIWCAFYLARGISKPIQELLLAIRKIRQGNLDVRVEQSPSDDLRHLVHGFNEMTISLQRAYKELEFHNTEMMTMLEHIKESVFFINTHGRIVSFNASAKKIVSKYLDLSRFKNKKINFFGSKIKNLFFSVLRDLHKSEKNYLVKEISFSHDGEPKTFRVYMTIIQNAVLAKNKSILVVAEDLSEVYKVNKIKTWQEAAKQMAHEVKNPLTPIQLATQRLQRKLRKSGADDPVLIDCTDTILQQVKIIKDLVSHFSEFAKMPGLKIEQLDINKIIKETCSLYEMSYPDILFSLDLHKFLPACKADRKKLKRVIVNLLDNSVRALKNYSSPSPKTITIKTDFRTRRNQIELVICDNGPGIPHDVREKLFLPYVSTGSKNMGLGLAIVHDIVGQMGGSIKLIPSSQGASFRVLLSV